MANIIKSVAAFKALIDGKYLVRGQTKAEGFWEIRKRRRVLISCHRFKDLPLSGFLDENAKRFPNHAVVLIDGEPMYIPIEWATIISKEKVQEWRPIKEKSSVKQRQNGFQRGGIPSVKQRLA